MHLILCNTATRLVDNDWAVDNAQLEVNNFISTPFIVNQDIHVQIHDRQAKGDGWGGLGI